MDARDIEKYAKQHGFEVTRTKVRHYCFRHPLGGPPVYHGSTSASRTGGNNAVATLRRVMRQLGIPDKRKP